MKRRCVPAEFKYGYVVSIPKMKDFRVNLSLPMILEDIEQSLVKKR